MSNFPPSCFFFNSLFLQKTDQQSKNVSRIYNSVENNLVRLIMTSFAVFLVSIVTLSLLTSGDKVEGFNRRRKELSSSSSSSSSSSGDLRHAALNPLRRFRRQAPRPCANLKYFDVELGVCLSCGVICGMNGLPRSPACLLESNCKGETPILGYVLASL